MRSLTGGVISIALLLASCSSPMGPTPTPSPDKAVLSQSVIDRVVSPADGPGCAAAVGDRGAVVWQGSRGVADLDAGAPITESTIFEIGSVTKQFTATAILLLVADGRLSLDDHLSEHLSGQPAWGDAVTIDQLIHHDSGIPEYFPRLQAKGYDLETLTQREAALEVIANITRLDSEPGTQFYYSNSNYLLLGYVIERVTGQALAAVLADRIFRPLGLELILEPIDPVAGKARSYRWTSSGTGYQLGDWKWDAAGAAGIQSGVADLVRWGDNYRTGKLGGRSLLDAQVAGAVDVGAGDGTRYGAGIAAAPDGSLFHPGTYGGFRTLFTVSADRTRVLAVACNLAALDVDTIAQQLAEIWK